MAEEKSKPLNIGLIQRGSVDWVGGIELEKNLVEATLRYAGQAGEQVTFTLLGTAGSGGSEGAVSAADAFRNISQHEWPPPGDEEEAGGKWWERIFPPAPEKVEKTKRAKLRLAKGRYLDELGVDFLYPPFKIPAGFREKSAAWLCDFQHKFLPEYFSAREIKQRDHRFGAIARQASTVVVSSETAAGHFKQFYPESGAEVVSLPFRVILPPTIFEKDCKEV